MKIELLTILSLHSLTYPRKPSSHLYIHSFKIYTLILRCKWKTIVCIDMTMELVNEKLDEMKVLHLKLELS
jgi:hypothetical protein